MPSVLIYMIYLNQDDHAEHKQATFKTDNLMKVTSQLQWR